MTPTGRVREYAILEYYKVLGMLAERAVSDLAKERCLALTPDTCENNVKRKRAETDDAVSVCLRKGTPPFANLPDLSEQAGYAEKGGSLLPRQLLLIAAALGSAKRVRGFLSSDMPEGAASVRRASEGIVLLPELEKRITDSISPDNELNDGASPALRRIRRAIDQQNEKIRASLARFINGRDFDDVLMDKVITMRNGRFVVPVKQEQQGKFPGIVHDRSKGGATVFVEPQLVVDMNNKLRGFELEEQVEIERILAELSAEVGAVKEPILNNQELLILLDFYFAKGNLACDMRACPADLASSGTVDIVKGRNPLIAADAVVPVSINFGGEERILIITGPNTGGKTVTLKTVGLFVLMAQAGLHVPAARAILPVVSRVFADIGDEQSIEQSLSTFSSHMKNIVEIVNEAGENCVVLLDELGAGTDPTEGAALALAILGELRERGCLVVATTHFTELKKYAISAEGVENASMEFDVETLSPTYRLSMGNPGRSNAFEIASRLGLKGAVVAGARDLMDSEAISFDDVMEQLERDRVEGEELLKEAERANEAASALLASGEERLRAIEKERTAILAAAEEEAESLVEEAREEADSVSEELKSLIRDVRTRGVADGAGSGDASPVDAGDALRKANESRKRLKKRGKRHSRTQGPSPSVLLCPGDIVALPGSDSAGEVLTAPDDRGRVAVRAGAVKLTLAADELVKVEPPAKKPGQGKGRYAKIVISKMDSISPSIDLHGLNLDEAEMLVEKYLDDAMLARMHEVVICHGRGSGVLRDGIRRMLRGHKHVAKYRKGDFDEGGDGVTVVTLSDK